MLIRRPATPVLASINKVPCKVSATVQTRALRLCPETGSNLGDTVASLTEKQKSWVTNCAWLFAAFRGTSQPSLLCKWKERASNRASYCLITSLQAPCTFLQPVNLFFIRCLQTFWREQKTASKRDGASVTERDPSPSSSAYHEGVTPQAWRCSKSTSL